MEKRFPLLGNVCEYGEGYNEGGRVKGSDETQTLIRFVSYNIHNVWKRGIDSELRGVS